MCLTLSAPNKPQISLIFYINFLHITITISSYHSHINTIFINLNNMKHKPGLSTRDRISLIAYAVISIAIILIAYHVISN